MPRSYADAVDKLNGLQTNFAVLEAVRNSGGSSNKNAIEKMIEYVQRSGYNPEDMDDLNLIHVTGTKGKGSTCALTESILRNYEGKKKLKTGLYTSPHLMEVRERIRINGAPISQELFAKYFFEVWDRLDSTADKSKPGYFRFLTMVAFHVFKREKVDVAILEVGIGGAYDSTNIIKKPIVCGISALGIDHVSVLGSTLGEIAWNKGGIFKSGVPAVSSQQPEEGLTVLENRAKELGATSLQIIPPFSDEELKDQTIGLAGKHQAANAALASAICRIWIEKVLNVKIDAPAGAIPKEFSKGLSSARWPGRGQIIVREDKPKITWFFDGAHTAESTRVCAAWFKDASQSKIQGTVKKILVFNCTGPRDGDSLLGPLAKIQSIVHFDEAVFTPTITFASNTYKGDLVNNITAMDPELKTQNILAACWTKQVGLASGSDSEKVKTTVLPSIEHTVNWIDDYVKSGVERGVDNVQNPAQIDGCRDNKASQNQESEIMSEAIIQDLCLVERILQKRVDTETGAVEYLIRWQGTDAQGNEYEDTWEPEHNILGDELIEEFERKQASKRPQRQRSPGRPKSSWREAGELGQETTQKGQISSQYVGPAEPVSQLMGSRQPLSLAPQQPGMAHPFDQHPPPPPPPGYFHGHPSPYAPHYSHPHYPTPPRQPLISGPSPYNTRTKRKLPSTSNNDQETAEATSEATSVTQGNSNQESASMEGVKRQKEGNSLRSQIQTDKYVGRRQISSTSGTTSTTMRLLKLHFDNEKAYFISIIEKSTLVKDVNVRSEMVRFLKDPKYPGLAQGAKLLESETWLIELKQQIGSSGSLFLALDIPRGEVKALFIPEWMLEYQRKAQPDQGIVLKDRTVVSAIMEGDLHGSGLYPPEATEGQESQHLSIDASSAPTTGAEGSQQSSVAVSAPTKNEESQQSPDTTTTTTTTPAAAETTEAKETQQSSDPTPLAVADSASDKEKSLQPIDQGQRRERAPPVSSPSSSSLSPSSSTPASPAHQVGTDGDITMEETSENFVDPVQTSLLHCEWKNCQQTRATLDELSKHVLQDHLQGLLASSSLAPTTPPVNVEIAASVLAEGSSWQARYELSQATYRSLQDQIARTKDIALKMDQKIQESRILYTSAVAKSKENIKRLEAHLEWEMKKWNKYQEQKSQMAARITDPDGSSEFRRKGDANTDPNAKRTEPSLSDLEAIKLDKPMEAQSINTIRDIQRTLAAAKEDLARLEEDNLALFEKRRTLDTELKTLDEQFQRTIAQLAELKAKEHTTREEIKSRSQSIEECKATMEQEQVKAREVLNQLQSVIETMKQSEQQQHALTNGQEGKNPSTSSSTTAASASASLPMTTSVTALSSASTPSHPISQQSDSTKDLQATDPAPSNTTSNFTDSLISNVNGAGSENL
ncbi:Folylpolyglutamate synthetase [Mortierella sp. AD094]|nr:Folylpolyglutamate synthetase [Mortierella sp. AD094]